MSKSTVTVPAELVNLLREAMVCELAERAGAIQNSGYSHPDAGIPEEELAAFDTQRGLLEKIGCLRWELPAAVELDLAGHCKALVVTLENRLELERGVIEASRKPDDPKQRRAAERNIRQIEAFMANNHLLEDNS